MEPARIFGPRVTTPRVLGEIEAITERQPVLDGLRQEFADALNAILDEETAAKIVESMGRYPGVGARGARAR